MACIKVRMNTILRKLLLALLLAASLAFAGAVQHFSDESEAQRHCPTDTVVWVNTATGVYHYAGQRWYANTKHGAFVCKSEADSEGDRAARNGQ